MHNYAHLLQVTVPRSLAIKATLADLCAYSASFAPPDALQELTALGGHCGALQAPRRQAAPTSGSI